MASLRGVSAPRSVSPGPWPCSLRVCGAGAPSHLSEFQGGGGGLGAGEGEGQAPCDKILSWGLCYSWVLAKLSDLSQELKGILFGFKIFSSFNRLKIRYHKYKTSPQIKR